MKKTWTKSRMSGHMFPILTLLFCTSLRKGFHNGKTKKVFASQNKIIIKRFTTFFFFQFYKTPKTKLKQKMVIPHIFKLVLQTVTACFIFPSSASLHCVQKRRWYDDSFTTCQCLICRKLHLSDASLYRTLHSSKMNESIWKSKLPTSTRLPLNTSLTSSATEFKMSWKAQRERQLNSERSGHRACHPQIGHLPSENVSR